MGMITLYTQAQQMLFCGLGVFLASLIVGFLGVCILHRGVLSDKRVVMYSGWVITGVGCILYVVGWWIILSNRLVPDGPGSVMDHRAMLMLPFAVVMGIVYAAREYARKHDDYKKVVNTAYVLALFVGFIPIIMLFFY